MRAFEALENRRLMASDFAASINFAPLTSQRAPGLLADYGGEYAVRRGGLSYGWDHDKTADTVERNVTKIQKNDTFIGLTKGDNWNIEVPNGEYQVYVVAGDPAAPGSRMALDVEGDTAIAGVTRKSKMFLEGAVTVNVTDGKLTITSVGEYGADKLSYLAIQSVSGGSSDPSGSVVTTSKISWTTGKKELVPTTEPESAVVGDKLYVFSGYGDKSNGGDGWQPSTKVQRYDPKTGTWAIIGNMPIGTTHAAVTVVGTDVWFAGGYTARAGTTTKQDVTST
ncbi:MAG: extracellular repeat protein family, partial [Phycisphaerales bacterium]|nr:extracellular repeat protein family [Phycisphaerales bacterium]